jgi:hypothetical protein
MDEQIANIDAFWRDDRHLRQIFGGTAESVLVPSRYNQRLSAKAENLENRGQ